MNKKIIITSVALAVFAGAGYALNMQLGDKVVATVNSNPVYQSEIIAKIKDISKLNPAEKDFDFNAQPLEVKQNIVKGIVVTRLVNEKADEAKISETDNFKKIIEIETEQIKQKLFIDQISKDAVSDDKVKEKYNLFVADLGKKEEIKVVHIVFADEQSAKDAQDKIAKGESFEAVLSSVNPDNKDETKGGTLDFFAQEEMPKPFSDAAFALAAGGISAPVQTEFGWHLIKLVERRDAKVPTLQEMSQKIKNELLSKFVQDYVEALIKDNKVEISIK